MENKKQAFTIEYITKRTIDLSDKELEECAALFGNSYGRYNVKAGQDKAGRKIKMPVSYYKKNYCHENFFVATASLDGKLLGHAFYVRKSYLLDGENNHGKMTWVLQLVVDENYRKQGIASTLLRSIWGFSDDYAWGLATTNPCTVKTLESATFRKCNPAIIEDNLHAIKLIGDDISFVRGAEYYVDKENSQINTEFYVDNSEFLGDFDCTKQLGELISGYEWLAFTFQSQKIDIEKYKKHFDEAIVFSERVLKEAYSRMDIENHVWSRGTSEETDFIEKYIKKETCRNVLDVGCGIGRHSIELAKRGYNVKGIDFSDRHIMAAKLNYDKENVSTGNCVFECADAREFCEKETYDCVICLYDVVGSFPIAQDNEAIIKKIYENLKKGGVLVISVMNMELTESIVPEKQKGIIKENPEILMKLLPENIMQSTGDIFDGKHLAIDTENDLVYRKEQFGNDLGLSAEYVIRDKRYKMKEIAGLIEGAGFQIIEKRYVRAGHFNEKLDALDKHAKEICIVARK